MKEKICNIPFESWLYMEKPGVAAVLCPIIVLSSKST
jgi:hypothetical protein